MELEDVIRQRRMTRTFSSMPVEAELLDDLISTALRAPSAGFTQGVELIAITAPEARAHFWELATDEAWHAGGRQPTGPSTAPAIVLPLADPGAYVRRYSEQDKKASMLAGRQASQWPVPYWIVDASFVVMQLLLAATDRGLGALFFQLHSETDTVLDGLGAPSGLVVIGAVAIGHRYGTHVPTSPSRRPRRRFDEVVHRQRW